MLKSVQGVFRDGKIHLNETPADIQEADVIVTFLPRRGQKTRGRPKSRDREDAFWRLMGDGRQKFEGEWVALEGETIVAHGKDCAAVGLEARSKGIDVPYIFFVEQEREPNAQYYGL